MKRLKATTYGPLAHCQDFLRQFPSFGQPERARLRKIDTGRWFASWCGMVPDDAIADDGPCPCCDAAEDDAPVATLPSGWTTGSQSRPEA